MLTMDSFDFLSGRTQQFVLCRSFSNNAGVPQGTVLGPILFLIMKYDIDSDVKYSHLASFADDTRVLKEVNDLMDTFKMQYDLNKIFIWTIKNNMTLNNCKFEHLKYGKDNDTKNFSKYLTDNGTIINNKKTVKDLGVLMSDDCSFTEHINKVSAKTKDMSSWILRTFTTRDRCYVNAMEITCTSTL